MPTATKSKTGHEKAFELLAQLAGSTVGDDSVVFQGTKIVLPAQHEDNVQPVIDFLKEYQRQQSETFNFNRSFLYRPWDGAAAFDRAMKRVFGTSGIGKATQSLFGSTPPQMVSIAVGPNKQLQVPWGQITFSPLKASFFLGSNRTAEHGLIFTVEVEAPLKYRKQIEGFFAVVEEELRERSIYRGKAIVGTDEPTFMDTDAIDPNRAVYSEEVFTQLNTNLWSLIRHSDAMRRNKIPLKRAILLEGQYGTGKTMACQLTAKEAVANGWTYIQARPGKDNLFEILKTAQLYAPAVVAYEDMDVVAKGENDTQISQLLDALDGITAKGVEVLAAFTTNFASKIQKAVLRPGRLDAVIHIGAMDDIAIEKLTRLIVPTEQLSDTVDYQIVADAFLGETMRLPAFVAEAIGRAMRYSIARNEGELTAINTEDLVNAANGLRDQVELMEKAAEGVVVPDLDQSLTSLLADTIDNTKLVPDPQDYHNYKLAVNGTK